jgi:hypothetical protein
LRTDAGVTKVADRSDHIYLVTRPSAIRWTTAFASSTLRRWKVGLHYSYVEDITAELTNEAVTHLQPDTRIRVGLRLHGEGLLRIELWKPTHEPTADEEYIVANTPMQLYRWPFGTTVFCDLERSRRIPGQRLRQAPTPYPREVNPTEDTLPMREAGRYRTDVRTLERILQHLKELK